MDIYAVLIFETWIENSCCSVQQPFWDMVYSSDLNIHVQYWQGHTKNMTTAADNGSIIHHVHLWSCQSCCFKINSSYWPLYSSPITDTRQACKVLVTAQSFHFWHYSCSVCYFRLLFHTITHLWTTFFSRNKTWTRTDTPPCHKLVCSNSYL